MGAGLIGVGVLAWLTVLSVYDLRSRRLPNWLTLPGAVVIFAVAALFGLTAAEARVTAMVAEGFSRAEIAAAHGVSDGTVKSQLGVIFQKTNAGDQRELQRLVRELTPPVRAH